jgi:putative two-component system response regulator
MSLAAASDAVNASPSVLVVDDEETVRNLLSLIVSRAGGRAELAETGKEARDRLGARRYACALLDKNLPDMTGLELMREIRASSPHTQCLIVTGYASTESAIEAVRLGAFDYIVKPFDVAVVQNRVRQALERGRLAAELDDAMASLRKKNAELTESKQEIKRAYLESVLQLSRAVEYKDDAAPAHVARISRYAGVIARQLDARPEWIEDLALAAPLHDIGKVGVADAILRKPGPLDADERRQVEEHVAIGARILEGATADVLVLARELVLTHHERWDGAGYPHKLRGEQIPLSGRIVSVCDAWDAVSTDRVYRKAMTFHAAVEEIRRGAGAAYDPRVVEAFEAVLPQVRAILAER